MAAPLGRLSMLVIDAPHAHQLASFYSAITGWPLSDDSDAEWVELDSGGWATIGFQHVENFRPPQWPGQDVPQQAHLDFAVDDLDEAEAAVLALGATKCDFQPGTGYRVFLDPVGHPFCLVTAEAD